MSVTIHIGDCREVLRTLPDQSVHCCVTSPPYFGLRDYEIEPTDWPEIEFTPLAGLPSIVVPPMRCCLGLEPDPQAFIAHIVDVFRGVHRVLRDDGTLWVNLGDSYASSGRGGSIGNWSGLEGGITTQQQSRRARELARTGNLVPHGLKPKDLMGIPWRVAYALQADGWYLRQDIIWCKPNPMPESVRDRCTKSHEYLFLLSKSERYYFDAEAIREPMAAASFERLAQNVADQAGSDRVPGKNNGAMKAVARGTGVGFGHGSDASARARGRITEAKGNRKSFRGGGIYTRSQSFANSSLVESDTVGNEPNFDGMRNKRSVWTVATQPFKEAHFATYPVALIQPCILAGAPAGGVVLDPFGGPGTTAIAAEMLGRDAVLIELNPVTVGMAKRRLATTQSGLPLGATA